MKELEFLKIIQQTLSKNTHIGDDCAHLKDLGIVVTHDSLVEDIHFCTKYSTPYQIGYKSIMVNLSDIFASGAVPKYFTISLSLPKNTTGKFVKEFYKAVEDLSKEFDFEVIGGDITGSDKIFVSVCAIGLTKGRNISSRSHAKAGDYVITTGVHGSSAAQLFLLKETGGKAKCKMQNEKCILAEKLKRCPSLALCRAKPDQMSGFARGGPKSLISREGILFPFHFYLFPSFNHLLTLKKLSSDISTKIKRDYAMMDTSDGLADALFKIAQASNITISVDFDKIPYDKEIENIAQMAKIDFKDWIFYGGEDFQLIACIDAENLEQLSSDSYTIIGTVKKKSDNFVEIIFDNKVTTINNLKKTFNHFN
ncbi:MAG: thiamine-phosphate kinase [Candidatus Gastranaerophilales bacterium]|nr:thiamine-phosphate kinase [Candidatus Gastranaerophilales bacterium]